MPRIVKDVFIEALKDFSKGLTDYVSANQGDWSVKGFIDIHQNIYTISSDTKIISKILEIQIFSKFQEFAEENNYELILAEKQNWYPDLMFVNKNDTNIKFAVDIKTTYRLPYKSDFCNGFTLGSHGEYFKNRKSSKNVQYPYGEYAAHICLGILYTRTLSVDIDETRVLNLSELDNITSVVKNFNFFVEEKWKIASDRSGSGNTANIGSITYIPDIISGNGVFVNLGENIFDEYWINQGILTVPNPKEIGKFKKLTNLDEFLKFKNMDCNLINRPCRKQR